MGYSTDHSQFSSVAQSCLTLCNPMNCSMSGLPVHHQLPEFTQTHAHRVGDAIQTSHLLSSPSPPAPIPPSIRVFSNESTLHTRWPKYWSFSLNAVVGCNLKNDRMISVHFQGKPFNIMVIQAYVPTSNAEEAEVEGYYEELQEL